MDGQVDMCDQEGKEGNQQNPTGIRELECLCPSTSQSAMCYTMAEGPEREGALTAQATATKRVKKQHKTGFRAFSRSEFRIRDCGCVFHFGLNIPK